MNAKSASSTRVEMSQVVTTNDANFIGKAFGGTILSMVDLAAYAIASRFAGNICVTASFDRVDFLAPVEIGEIVTTVGMVTFVGRTSVEVTIDVFAENVYEGVKRHTNTARVTMVALKSGKPVKVPRLLCETREEKLRFLEGKLRRELRGRHQKELQHMAEGFLAEDDAELDRLIEAPTLAARM